MKTFYSFEALYGHVKSMPFLPVAQQTDLYVYINIAATLRPLMQYFYVDPSYAFAPLYSPAMFYNSASSVLNVVQSNGGGDEKIEIDPLFNLFVETYNSTLEEEHEDTLRETQSLLKQYQTVIETLMTKLKSFMQEKQAELKQEIVQPNIDEMEVDDQPHAVQAYNPIQTAPDTAHDKRFQLSAKVFIYDKEDSEETKREIKGRKVENTTFEYTILPSHNINVQVTNDGSSTCELHAVYENSQGEIYENMSTLYLNPNESEFLDEIFWEPGDNNESWTLKDNKENIVLTVRFVSGTEVEYNSKEILQYQDPGSALNGIQAKSFKLIAKKIIGTDTSERFELAFEITGPETQARGVKVSDPNTKTTKYIAAIKLLPRYWRSARDYLFIYDDQTQDEYQFSMYGQQWQNLEKYLGFLIHSTK